MGLFDGIKARPILKQIEDNEAKLKNDEAFLENLISLNQGGVRNLDIFEKAKYLRQFNKDILEKRKQYIKLAYKPGYDQKQAILEAESKFVVRDYKYTKAIKDAGYKCEIGREIDYAGLMRDRILASDGNQYEALLEYIPSEIENYQELCVEIVSQKPNLLTLIKNPTPAMFEAAKNSRNSSAVDYAADHIPEFREYLEKSKSTVIVENNGSGNQKVDESAPKGPSAPTQTAVSNEQKPATAPTQTVVSSAAKAAEEAETARKAAEEAARIKAEAEAAAKREAEARAAEEAAAKKAEWLRNKEALFATQKAGFEKHAKNFYEHENPLLAMPELNNTIKQLQTYLPQIKNAVASNNQEEINRILGEIQSKTPGIVKGELESLLSGDGRYFSPEATLKGLQGEMLACQRAISNIEDSIYFGSNSPDPVLQEMKARLEKMIADYSEAYKNMQGVKELILDIRKKVAEARIAAKSARATVKKEEPVVENNGSGTAGVDEVEAKRQAEEAAARKAAEEAARIKAEAEAAAKREAEEAARKRAEEEAKRETEEAARLKAEAAEREAASVAPVVSASSKIVITAEEMRTIEEEARSEVLAEMGAKANKRNKQKVVEMKIARLVDQKRRKLMGQKAQGKTESAPVEKDVEEPKIEPVVPVQVSEKAARKAASKAAAIEKANEEARIARENFEREMAEKRAAAEKDAPAVSESTKVETVSADRPVSVAATTTPKPSEPIQRDGLTEFLVPYAKKYADYYSGDKGTRGHARDKEEQASHRKITYQMKKLISKRIEEVSMGDDGTVNQEIMQTLSQPVDMLDFEELVADERATLKLFEIAASGVYEDGGQRVRLTRKQRVALAGVLVKVADRKLEIENKKAQEAATKKMGQGLEAEGAEKI